MSVGSVSSAMDTMIQHSAHAQGQALLQLMDIVKQAQVAQAKPLANVSKVSKVDVSA